MNKLQLYNRIALKTYPILPVLIPNPQIWKRSIYTSWFTSRKNGLPLVFGIYLP